MRDQMQLELHIPLFDETQNEVPGAFRKDRAPALDEEDEVDPWDVDFYIS